jgi:hypothetical protein
MDQDLLEYVSSQITFDASMNAETNKRCPDDPRAVGKRAFSRWRRTRAAKVTEACSFVLWRAYAMKWGSFTVEFDEEGGYSGQAKRWVMNRAHNLEACSWP